MKIRILGAACKKCKSLEANTRKAVEELGINAEVEKVTDMETIIGYGVMSIPALVVNDEVKSVGKVLNSKQIKEMLND